MDNSPAQAIIPIIHRLMIERFRGVKELTWHPSPGLNVVLGGGDVGKTTILDAIALLLNPTNSTILSDSDYWNREVKDGFNIEAVMSLPDSCGINLQTKSAWPWEWDGSGPQLPKVDDENPGTAKSPVYRLNVRGTEEFELHYQLLQPDGTADHLSVGVRRAIGLVRLSGDDRNDRDLRLVQGSALERLLSDKTLRARLGQKLSESDVGDELKDDAKQKLQLLDDAFQKHLLPSDLALGLTGGQGQSVNALIGLTAAKGTIRLPLASWGAGTRRLAALEIAASYQAEFPITLVDEIERGLEPYRQRVLVGALQGGKTQTFATTHSVTAVSAATAASLWYMDAAGAIGSLPRDKIAQHQVRDPETFLAKLAIVAEGVTEVGFLSAILEKAIEGPLLDHGIRITDGQGNDSTIDLLEALAKGGLKFGGFADNEGTHPGRWSALQAKLGNLLFRWPKGCLEENIIALLTAAQLEEFIKDPEDERTGERLRTLATRLSVAEKDFATIAAKTGNLPALIAAAATGSVPDDKQDADSSEKKTLKKHSQHWFKSAEGGRELAGKVFQFGLWPKLEPQLLPFLNAVRQALSLAPITSLPP